MANSLADRLALSCQRFAALTAVSDEDDALSYAEFGQRAEGLARELRASGLPRHAPVIVKVANRARDIVAFQAVWLAGGVVVPLHRDTPAQVLLEALSSVRPAAVVDGDTIDMLASQPEIWSSDLQGAALIVLTSGSTGKPKGVILSHAAFSGKLDANQSRLRFSPAAMSLLVLQITFSFGIWFSLLTLQEGGHLLIRRKFSPATIWDASSRYAVANLAVVPTMIRSLLNERQAMPRPLSSPRLLTGGEPLANTLIGSVLDMFPGAQIVDIYGLTETCTSDFMSIADSNTNKGGIGLPAPEIEFRIVDEQGEHVLKGEAGELQIKTPFIMNGYLNEPELTASAFSGKFFKTGDVARERHDGTVELVGRAKELISRGGNKIAPLELDHIIMRHPDVADVLTAGVPDQLLGERIHVLVVPKPGASLDESGLRDWLSERLDRFKRPDIYHFGREIPLGRSGKGDRRLLRESIIAGKIA